MLWRLCIAAIDKRMINLQRVSPSQHKFLNVSQFKIIDRDRFETKNCHVTWNGESIIKYDLHNRTNTATLQYGCRILLWIQLKRTYGLKSPKRKMSRLLAMAKYILILFGRVKEIKKIVYFLGWFFNLLSFFFSGTL